MHRRAIALLVALLSTALAGCVSVPTLDDLDPQGNVAAYEPGPRLFTGYVHESVDVPSPGGLAGVKVHVDLWRPDPATFVGDDAALATAPAPVIVDAGPYFGAAKRGPDRRGAHYVHEWAFDHMIPRGYAFAAVETPGSAGSSGCWDFMGPQETAAMAAAVDWLGSQEWSNGKVGMIGKSYDGMTQIMAASEHPERLATIVPVAPLTHAYAGVYMNGVPYVGFWGGAAASYTVLYGLADVPYHTQERVPNAVTRIPDHVACTPENVAFGVGNMGDYNDYYKARDFRASAKEITIPVFFMQGFLDRNVRADNAFPYVNDLAGPTMVWLGQFYHDYANATYAGRDDMYLTLGAWFDRWLKGVENDVEERLGFHVQDSEGRWRREASWPPADAEPYALRLADGKLSPDVATAGAGASFLDDAQVTWEFGVPPPTGLVMPSDLTWVGEAFPEDTHVAGPAVLSLNVSSSGTRGQVVALLWDCDAGLDDCDVVTRGAMSLLHRNGLERGEPLVPGETVSVTFGLQPRDYVYLAGRVPVLTVAGTDLEWFMPEATRNVITVHESEDAPSLLTLPVVARDPTDAYLVSCGRYLQEKDCHDPELRDKYPDE